MANTPSQISAASTSSWYFFVGLIFCFGSRSHGGNETHWGYTLSGITCLILASWFVTLHLNRETVNGQAKEPESPELDGASKPTEAATSTD